MGSGTIGNPSVTTVFCFKAGIYTIGGILLAAIDWKTLRLPHALTFPMAVFGFLFSFVPGNGLSPWVSFLGFVVGVFPLGILAWRRQRTFGFGDAVFAGAIGAFSGVMGVGIALLFGGFLALIVFRIRKEKGILPFGPFLASGGLSGILLEFVFRNDGFIHYLYGIN